MNFVCFALNSTPRKLTPTHSMTRVLNIICVCLLLTGCNLLKGKPEEEIIGRWENDSWSYKREHIYAEFTQDRKVKYLTRFGPLSATWMFLESGELQVSPEVGSSKRCNIEIKDKNLIVKTPACFQWEELGAGVWLSKQ